MKLGVYILWVRILNFTPHHIVHMGDMTDTEWAACIVLQNCTLHTAHPVSQILQQLSVMKLESCDEINCTAFHSVKEIL